MKSRHGISPVLATVILIAITLVAAIAIAGFVFGLFGSFTSAPQVSAQGNLYADNGPTGMVTLFDSGTAPATLQSISLTYLGQTCQASYSASGAIPAGGSLQIPVQPGQFPTDQCGQSGTTSIPSAGVQYRGMATLQGGFQIPFTGSFQ